MDIVVEAKEVMCDFHFLGVPGTIYCELYDGLSRYNDMIYLSPGIQLACYL